MKEQNETMEQDVIKALEGFIEGVKQRFVGSKESNGLKIIGYLTSAKNFIKGVSGIVESDTGRVFDAPLIPKEDITVANVPLIEALGDDIDAEITNFNKNIEDLKATFLDREDAEILESTSKLWLLGMAKDIGMLDLSKDTVVDIAFVKSIRETLSANIVNESQLDSDLAALDAIDTKKEEESKTIKKDSKPAKK